MVNKIIFLLVLITNANIIFACDVHQSTQKSKNYSILNNKSHNKLQKNIKPDSKESINK